MIENDVKSGTGCKIGQMAQNFARMKGGAGAGLLAANPGLQTVASEDCPL